MNEPRPVDRPKVLVLAFSPLAADARVLRQVRWLSEHHDVTSAAFGPTPLTDVDHIELDDLAPYRPGRVRRLRYIVRFMLRLFALVSRANARDAAAFDRLRGQHWDVVVANDVETLPLAFRLRPSRGVLADVHEYATKQNEHSRRWRWTEAPYARWLVRRWLGRADAVTTVSGGIADAYRDEFGIEADVITNASTERDLHPQAVGAPIRLVHSGIAAPQRHLEIMIDAVAMSTADVTLDLFLMDDDGPYRRELQARAGAVSRVRVNPPVPMDELTEKLNEFDVGLSVLPPTTFNLAWCLPNKFFDFVQARLGVVVGPSPEMASVVDAHHLGAVTDDFTAESLARTLDALTPDLVSQWKRASDLAASPLSGERQLQRFERVVDDLLAAAPKAA